MRSSLIATVTVAILPVLNVQAIPLASDNIVTRASDPVSQVAGILSNANVCSGSSSSECVKPADATEPILAGLYKYGITTAAEQSAVVALMAFESADFQYNHNVSPGRPGQGTRAMLMPQWITKYVDALPELTQGKAAAGGDAVKLLALVQDNKHSFAAGSWFYSTQCSSDVKSQLRSGSRAGWENYIKACVGTDASDDRAAYWNRARQQLGLGTA